MEYIKLNHDVDKQGTIREHSFRELLGGIQGTVREQSGNSQGTVRESVNQL
jgi:hypothetical protein